jgi:ribosomal protein S18 acetylase RimI-like enzyme
LSIIKFYSNNKSIYGPKILDSTYRITSSSYLNEYLLLLKKTDHPNPKERIDQLSKIQNKVFVSKFYKDVMLGFACFEQLEDGTLFLLQVAVLPQVRNQGIGKSLMRSYGLFLKDIPKAYTFLVRSENTYAISFYKKQGFTVAGEG